MPRPLTIAFLACNKNPDRFREDASWLYRCDNLAAALGQAGHAVHQGHWRRFGGAAVRQLVGRAAETDERPARRAPDIIVLHRPQLSLGLRARLWWWRRQGTLVLADVDDLVFLPELAPQSPGVLNGWVGLPEIRRRFAAHAAALALVDGVTVSTTALASEVAARWPGKPVLVLHNAVHHSWRTEASTLQPPGTDATHPGPVIRYLPGTRSHERDFAAVAPVLASLLQQHPEVQFDIVGPLTLPEPFPLAQVRQRSKLPFDQYKTAVCGATVNLAPLEPTRFNASKSGLKVVEAAWWGVPTLCSPNADTHRLAQAGAGAVQACSLDAWRIELERVLFEPAHRAALASDLRERVLAVADIHADARTWLGWVQGRLPVGKA
ncbi:MAG: hypothetical protein CFE46_17920 [Burkholderiales bacterium PBB6]|nr:MAG: hypothetical protein CFE46_17920 [Burkholderiales bacterium PBB6]